MLQLGASCKWGCPDGSVHMFLVCEGQRVLLVLAEGRRSHDLPKGQARAH